MDRQYKSGGFSFTELQREPKLGTGAWSGLPGVYCIRCIANGKMYVGSSCDMANRTRVHFWKAKRQEHHSRKFQAAFNKYGQEAFQIDVLEYVHPSSVDIQAALLETEQKWISRLDVVRRGFNITPTAGSAFGIRKTEAQRKAIGERASKRFRVISPTGEMYDVKGLRPFCQSKGLNAGAMNQVAIGKNLHHKGWRCEYWDAPFPAEHWGELDFKALAEAGGARMLSDRQYRVSSVQGDHLIVHNLAEFCRQRGLSAKCLSATAAPGKNKQNWHKGWRCERTDAPQASPPALYIIRTPEGQEVRTENLSGFCTENGLKKGQMFKVLKGMAAHHKGFKVRLSSEEWPTFQRLKQPKRGTWWRATAPSGEAYEFQNLSQFCKEYGLTGPLMYNQSRGFTKHHKGWRCERITPPEPKQAV